MPLVRNQNSCIIKYHSFLMVTEWLNKDLNEVVKGMEEYGSDLKYIRDFFLGSREKQI